jgi:tetratricopeptide (TPR) repeat protein
LQRSLIPYAVLTALVLSAFGASLSAGFHFDDYSLFTDPFVTSPDGWWQVWRAEQTRPLTYFTFWGNYAAGGREPMGYHLVNLLLHLASVLLLYGPLRKLIPGTGALIATALFAIHPIQTEPVVYIYARATLLMSLFCILSLRSWVAGRHWPAAGWFAVALLAKEECVAFPLFLLLLHLSISRNRRELRPIVAMLALSLAAGLRVIYVLSQAERPSAGIGGAVSAVDYLTTQGYVILRYFQLLLVPVGFTVDPDIPFAGTFTAVVTWGAVIAICALGAKRFRGAREGFWLLAGLILLLPSSSIFPANDLAADRRAYLPLVGFAGCAALLLSRRKQWLAVAICAVLLVLTLRRVHVWQTEETLWAEAVERSPNKVRPKIQLARVSSAERALGLLERAKEIAPGDAAVASELGRIRLEAGQTAEALSEFGRSLAISPTDPRAHNNRGVALAALGQNDAARQDFRRALELDPCLFDAVVNLRRLHVDAKMGAGCRLTPEQAAALMAPLVK